MKSTDVFQPFWRRHLLVPSFVLLGSNALVAAAFTLPRVVRERTLASRVEGLRSDVEAQRDTAERVRRKADTIRSNQQDAERLYVHVVGTRGARLVPVLQEIEKTARDLGLEAGRGTYGPDEVKGHPLVRFVIQMPLEGSYDQLVSFLDRLERSPQFLIVDQLELRERRGESRAELSIQLSTYFKAEPDSGGSRGR